MRLATKKVIKKRGPKEAPGQRGMTRATSFRHPSARRPRQSCPVPVTNESALCHTEFLGLIPGILLENVCERPRPDAILAEGEAAAFSMCQCCCSPGSAFYNCACWKSLGSSLFGSIGADTSSGDGLSDPPEAGQESALDALGHSVDINAIHDTAAANQCMPAAGGCTSGSNYNGLSPNASCFIPSSSAHASSNNKNNSNNNNNNNNNISACNNTWWSQHSPKHARRRRRRRRGNDKRLMQPSTFSMFFANVTY